MSNDNRKKKRIDLDNEEATHEETVNCIRKRGRFDSVNDQPILLDLSFETDKDPANDNDNDAQIELTSTLQSKDNDDEIVINTDKNVEKPRNKFIWTIDSEWDDLDKALEFLAEKGFVNYDYSALKCGLKFYYRCKLVPRQRKQWCAQRYTLYLPANNNKIINLRNQFAHDHDKILEGTVRPPSDEIEQFILDLFKCGTTKISDVVRNLDYARDKKGLFKTEQNPGTRQIEYMLKKFRKTEAPPMIKLGDMINWCNQHNQFPSDISDVFVFASEFSTFDSNLSFGYAFSTPLLLEILSNCTTICMDATYKLNWLGFPLAVLGTVDRAKHFHPLVYACVSHERTSDYEFVFKGVQNAIKTHLGKDFQPEILIGMNLRRRMNLRN